MEEDGTHSVPAVAYTAREALGPNPTGGSGSNTLNLDTTSSAELGLLDIGESQLDSDSGSAVCGGSSTAGTPETVVSSFEQDPVRRVSVQAMSSPAAVEATGPSTQARASASPPSGSPLAKSTAEGAVIMEDDGRTKSEDQEVRDQAQESRTRRSSKTPTRNNDIVVLPSGKVLSRSALVQSKNPFDVALANNEVPPDQEPAPSPLWRGSIDVPVDVAGSPAEPRRRNSILDCFTGDSGAPGEITRARSIHRSAVSRASGAIKRRFSSHRPKANGDSDHVNRRRSIVRPSPARGAPNDLHRQDGFHNSPVGAQGELARRRNAFIDAARRFTAKKMAADDNESFRQRFRWRRAQEDVTTDVESVHQVGTTGEGSANGGPDKQ